MQDTSGRIDLRNVQRVHLVGIAGSGLSGMARLLQSLGIDVTGSELKESNALRGLEGAGIRCFVGHDGSNIPARADLVVISAAIGLDNPEIILARERKIPVLKYAQMLGLLMAQKTGIAVAGTHGKTTTTSMVASILERAGRDPAFIIGGEYPGLGGSARWGSGRFFVAEACEFDRSFLNLHPGFAIIANIEEDHLDYFRSLEDIREAFGEFVEHLPGEGFLVLNADDPNSAHLPLRSTAPVGWFSLRPSQGDWWAEAIEPAGGGIRFLARSSAGETARLSLQVPGIHNVKNSLAVLALLRRIGLGLEEIAGGLEAFTGARRRFEVLRREPLVVIDDYAHHPTEVGAVLQAARETYPGRRIRLIFQPHQHSRMRRFLRGFAEVLSRADEAVVAEVFRARDTNEEVRRINSAALVREILSLGGRAVGAASFDDILGHLRATWSEGDVLIFLGAGDITLLARRAAEEAWEGETEPAVGIASETCGA